MSPRWRLFSFDPLAHCLQIGDNSSRHQRETPPMPTPDTQQTPRSETDQDQAPTFRSTEAHGGDFAAWLRNIPNPDAEEPVGQ